MKVCKRDGCTNEVSAKATWCSDACRKAASRTNEVAKSDIVRVKHKVGQMVEDHQDRMNSGRFTRPDGSQYQLDACGKEFDLTNGLVYQTIADVRKCYV